MRPIVCTSLEAHDDLIVQEAKKIGVEYFRGEHLNKIKRWSDCMEKFNLESAHIVDGDDPFFDTEEIENNFKKFKKSSVDLMRTSVRSDSGFASLGMSITSQFAKTLAERSKNLKSQNLDVIPWDTLLKESDHWLTAIDNFLLEDDETIYRLTLDYEEDYKLLRILADKFGPNVSRREVEAYLRENPSLNLINAKCAIDFERNKRVHLTNNFSFESKRQSNA